METADRLAALSPAKRALLSKLRAQGGPSADPIARADGDTAPLTSEQRRIWFMHRLARGAGVYTIPFLFRLHGRLDPAALKLAMAAVVARHDALRTVYREDGGVPVQSVPADGFFVMEEADLALLPSSEREEETTRRVAAFFRAPFDPERGHVFRTLLLRLRADEHLLALAFHHVAADGWSVDVVLRDLSRAYAVHHDGLEPRARALPEPPVRFVDYAAWHAARADDAEAARAVEWWRRELAGAPHVLEVPSDRVRPAEQDFGGARLAFTVPTSIAEGVRALGRGEGATAYPVLLAAWAATLARYAASNDVLVGTVTANRARPEVEALVGFFAATLPVRVRLEGDPTVAELVRRAHAAALGAQEHARAGFDRIVEAAGVQRDPSRPPLVQSIFAYYRKDGPALVLPGIEAVPEVADAGAAPFDLTLTLEDGPSGLRGELLYATSLFDATAAARIARHYANVVAAFAADPSRRLSGIDLADGDERRRVTVDWNRPAGGRAVAPDAADSACVHHLFEARARATPDAVAVVHDGREVTYGALERRANTIARELRKLGAGPEVRVGIRLPRTPELIAAMLGVLKAGAAYVPIDPAHPSARAEAVLRASGARLVLVERVEVGQLPVIEGVRSIDVESIESSRSKETTGSIESAESAESVDEDAPPGVEVDPRNVAYVIFTSGSTGGPKGVEVEHRSTVALLRWLGKALSDEERAGMVATSTVAFDASVGEIFGALCWGGTGVLVDNALALAREVPSAPFPVPGNGDGSNAGRHPRTAFLVPTAAAELLRSGRLPRTPRTVLVGGETVPQGLAKALRDAGVERVLNVYGPTEDTTYSTCAELVDDGEAVSIGRPVEGGRVYVLDAHMRPAGVGVPGEIFLGGAGVARGYAGRPGLTAERFLPDPFGPPGSRMYRSGDRGRFRDDGRTDHLGRADEQVKVRGFRIEPAEVEAALTAHPAIGQAAALRRGDALVAYLVGHEEDEAPRPGPAELRAWVRERLPDAMVPGAFAWVDSLPRTASGKVDRRALAAVDPHATPPARYVAPRTPVEETVAAVWREVLSAERVGVRDDFFELGGHSLLALRLVARLREATGADLPVAALMRAPTVEALARAVAGEGGEVRLPLVPLQPRGTRPPLFLAPPAGGHVVCYHALATRLGSERPVIGLQARGLEDGRAPLESLEEIADDFVEAVLRAQPRGPYFLGGWSAGGATAFEMARRLAALGHEVALVAMLDTAAPPDPDRVGDTLDHARVLQRIVSDVAGWAAAQRLKIELLRRFSPVAQAEEAIRQVNDPRRLPPSRRDELLELTRVRRAILTALVRYRPLPYSGRVVYVRTAASERMESFGGGAEYWGALALGGLELVRVSGNHGTLLHPPHVGVLAHALKAELDVGA